MPTFTVSAGCIKGNYAAGGAYQNVHTYEERLDFGLGDLASQCKISLAASDTAATANAAALLVAIDATVPAGALKTYLDAVFAAQLAVGTVGKDAYAGLFAYAIGILVMNGYYLVIT